MRVLSFWLMVIALLLFPVQKQSTPSNLLTTISSAMAAPYLDRPSGYIRPSIAQIVYAQRQNILQLAHRHNHPQITQFDDSEFAAIMITVLYTEELGWLEDAFPSIRPITPYYQDAQVKSNQWFGTNFSVWPANLRPSVVDEILAHEVPGVGHVTIPLSIPTQLLAPHYANILASQNNYAIELLAVNLERGIIRANAESVPVTWQTLLAWHNAGLVNPTQIAANKSLQHYLYRATYYRSSAIALYRDDMLCVMPIRATNAAELLKH
ncbi:MAG: hypothetical protein NT020_03245 [Chloroflexales bacterium]|nr:hypothetical protein [Chloroflexales bacterium]